jgi:hypothetical protein
MHIGPSSIWSLSVEFATFLHSVYQKPSATALPFEAEIFYFLSTLHIKLQTLCRDAFE